MRRLRFLFLVVLLLASPARALITIGDDAAFLQVPANGAPWDHVARLGLPGASAVYLGNGFLLTADHVNVDAATPVFLNNGYYSIDTSFGSGGLRSLANVDLKVLKIQGDPHLPALQIATSADVDLGVASTLIGWGKGKGAAVPNQGWLWGGDSTAVQRYGTNTTALMPEVEADGKTFLVTSFDAGQGSSEANLAVLDSGSGLFQMTQGGWKLAGIGVSVTPHNPDAALYDNDPAISGDQPDLSYFVRMGTYRDQILAATVPEPSLGFALVLGGGFCWEGGVAAREIISCHRPEKQRPPCEYFCRLTEGVGHAWAVAKPIP